LKVKFDPKSKNKRNRKKRAVLVHCFQCREPFLATTSYYNDRMFRRKNSTGRIFCSTKCSYKSKTITEEQFFRSTVRNVENGCLEWQGKVHHSGYGQVFVDRKLWWAHRYSWTLKNGYIPNGLLVCHKCDNKVCVDVEHLFLGTHQDNVQDMLSKNRHNPVKGESMSGAKLTDEIVKSCRKEHFKDLSSINSLSKKYNVSHATMLKAVYCETWSHIKTEWDGLPRQLEHKRNRNCNAKLSDAQINEIRSKYTSNDNFTHIARIYNVTDVTIRNILLVKTWKE
jgi:hypothetical protein